MIQSIRLKEFRKHEDLSLAFDPKWNLIYGRNNAGKSTLFYAIEYCFFGNVKGFKKIAQLAKYGSKILGVELHFHGKDGNLYKLQRLHTLKSRSRSANGAYTLKQIIESIDPIDPKSKIKSETYILSSDFGNREEELTLKLGELTGISKRFFESGIAFHQGTISDILNGSKKLDIVFGITAASALCDLFKSLTREYKKECAQLPNLTQLLDQILQEKKKRRNQFDLTISKISDIKEKIKARNEQYLKIIEFKEIVEKLTNANDIYRENFSKLEKDQIKKNTTEQNLADLVKKGGSLQQNTEEIVNNSKISDQINSKIEKDDQEIVRFRASIRKCEKSQVELKSTFNIRQETQLELKSLEKNHGNLDQLIQNVKKNEKDIQLLTHEKENNEFNYEKIQQNIRNWEQEKGNLSGIITRRKKTNETPRCEYCGAIIDKTKIKEEIIQSKKQLSDLNQHIISSEKEINTLKSRKDDILKKEKIARENLTSNKQNIDIIRNLKMKLNKFPKLSIIKADLTKFEIEIKDLEENIKGLEQNLGNLRENEKEVHTNIQTGKNQISQLQDSLHLIASLESEVNNSYHILETKKEKISNILKELEEFITNFETIWLKNPEEESFTHNLSVFKRTIMKIGDNLDLKDLEVLSTELKGVIITKESEINTSNEIEKKHLLELSSDKTQSEQDILEFDKKIAQYEQRITHLKNLESFREKYNVFQEIFDKIQIQIRKNISIALEEKILDFHRILSVDDEFEKIKVDEENYSLSIKPKNVTNAEFYPASVYQGGGHKLILGLAYKLALGELIGSPSFLLVDEPTEFMDSQNRINLLSNLETISKNAQILLITHQDVDKIHCNQKILIKK